MRVPTTAGDSQDQTRFLQDRLALYGKVIFILSAGFFIFANLVWRSLSPTSMVYGEMAGRVLHLLGAGAALVMWLVARQRRELSLRALHWMDAGGLLFMAAAYTGVGWVYGHHDGAHAALLAIVHITIARAVLIPSTAALTLILCVLSFAALPFLSWAGPAPGHDGEPFARVIGTVDTSLWCIAATILTVVASDVIYGLREQVREARQLGQYTLEYKIGQGGMGYVYRARHALLRRPTAIKLLIGEQVSEAQVARFEREVQLTSSLTHPNTISIYDYGRTPDGVFYYAMEYLDGLNLEELVAAAGPLPPGRVIHILEQACGALCEAHGIGLIHRDIKPANLLLCERGGVPDVVKVLDFGLVKELGSGTAVAQSSSNMITGTPLYMPPEAIVTPALVDARSDLYALGAVAYFLLTGRPVFEGETVVEVCSHHLQSVPEAPSHRLGRPLPADLEQLVLACLEKSPEKRPESAAALGAELARCESRGRWSNDQAAAWWAQHRASADDQPKRSAPGGPRLTLDINLQQRLFSP